MAPMIHCVRHGQGLHNLGDGNYSLRDPVLTPLGQEQCNLLRDTRFSDQSSVSLIVASPLCRTLQTACLIFSTTLTMSQKCFPKVLAYPDAQETSDEPCDVGLEVTEIEEMAAFNQWPIDLSLVKEGWNCKSLGSRYSSQSSAIIARARDTRRWLRQKSRELVDNGDEDVQIVLVTHGTFLHYFTEDWEDANTFLGTGWQNCESRSYEFANGVMNDLDAEARLTETIASRKKRGKSYPMYGIEQQAELFNLSMCQWRGQGF